MVAESFRPSDGLVCIEPSEKLLDLPAYVLFGCHLPYPSQSTTIDALYCPHLSVLKRLVMWFLWRLFEADMF